MEQTHSLSDEKMENKKTLEKAKHIFTDPSSVLFSEEKINNRLLEKKKKKTRYEIDSLLLMLLMNTLLLTIKKKYLQGQRMLRKGK